MPRLSYANVVATLALFIALGGSSYAALKLPRNSVGAAQIRSGAVHSSDVADGSLQAKDLSAAARGGGGGQVFFAHVSAGGSADRGNSKSAALESTGHYEVGFSQSPAACAWTATLGTVDDTESPAGRITVHQDGDHIGVQTFDSAGNPANLPFNVIMAC
jgi:hypothetical protein